MSFFERAGPAFFNSLVVADADGSLLGKYRKTHIPQNPGYEEKYYFSPGDTSFAVLETKFGRLGCGICWDQWFPETARALALKGAEVLMFPTAIGSEPEDPAYDSAAHWRRTMQGHAAANILPLVASNRIGTEQGARSEIAFYGTSFIAGPTGEILAEADRAQPGPHHRHRRSRRRGPSARHLKVSSATAARALRRPHEPRRHRLTRAALPQRPALPRPAGGTIPAREMCI
ncbi:MAG: nitrilase-related carbon-nitrogen hydrolase [Paracoccaceae bacterium]